MDNQIQIESQLESGLCKFEERVKGSGLIIWAHVLRKKFSEFIAARKAKDSKIYGELMQIESIASKCDSGQSKAIIDKVQALKALLAITILFFAVFSLNVQAVRTVRRDTVRAGSIHRVIRKKEAA